MATATVQQTAAQTQSHPGTNMNTNTSNRQQQNRSGGRGGGSGRGGQGRGNRGKGGRGGRGGRGGQGNRSTETPADGEGIPIASVPDSTDVQLPIAVGAENIGEAVEAADVLSVDGGDICWICAEPVKYYSLSACNHRTCHVCALRLRALYKKDDCTFCKEPQPEVIFTTSPDMPFSEYNTSSEDNDKPKFYDAKLRITFESQEMMTESLILLRFNCPDSECDYIAKGWGDLKMHVRAGHGRLMCDLCIRSKKVFAHEHVLYTYQQLRVHLPSMDHSPHARQRGKKPNTNPPAPEGGIHPLCEFCRECFFSEDELYGHMRERHEECFVCKREGVRDVYFASYPSLERHFTTAHYACTQPSCVERKFVVFGSALDLQAHMVEEHGMKDRRVVGFEFQKASAGTGTGGQQHSQSQSQQVPPPRQHPPGLPPPAPPQNQNQNQGQGQGQGQSKRRQGFGGALTSGDPVVTPNSGSALGTPAGPSRRASPGVPGVGVGEGAEDAERDGTVVDRHASFLNLLASLAPNPTNAIPAVQAAARGWRAGESSARDLIGIVWSVLDKSGGSGDPSYRNKDTLEPTARVINAFVDLLEEEEEREADGVDDKDKKSLELLREWKGFEVEQRRQFPDLFPTAIAASSTPGGAGAGAYAAITSGRVLNAKHSTHTSAGVGGGRFGSSTLASGSGPGSGSGGMRRGQQVWDRVAQAATGTGMGTGWGPPPSIPAGARMRVSTATTGNGPHGSSGVGATNAHVPGSLASVAAKARADVDREKFPPLGAGSGGGKAGGGGGGSGGGVGRKTPWASSGGSGTASSNPPSTSSSSAPSFRPFSVPASSSSPSSSSTSSNRKAPAPKLNAAAFPQLPTSMNKREKVQVKGNVSLRNILGGGAEVPVSRWGNSPVVGSATSTPMQAPPSGSAPGTPMEGGRGPLGEGEGGGEGGGGGGDVGVSVGGGDETAAGAGAGKKGKGGKGKGKQKQMLFTLGSFPT
ncbi:hypothetical protein GYMLUDRAFT_41590 [Collybiopsis luxurians FD-317 M1]|uniref:RING-type E3 ubiquitin transferase n=1 Tax=Collybiopsis luxurians FD-317 M1 TaxID=944289 RepID=A0A0D0CTD0_9AGAR|nr:hypothetical protein GYMLUDRAFT_41590 [Collybiopsis luxurians FD-317 M1]